ncbi:MAG: GntR family transcriptional regulator [Actinobacteria bacterium]|nr:GntR family transcriptional regulator [Actinomycetota bacterium]
MATESQLRRSSTADEVVALLRARIVSGELPPGTQLREVHLAREVGISRPTLREALQGLRQEGLVRHEPHRGMFVATLGAAEIRDIYSVRRVIEAPAARAAHRASAADLEAVGAAFERLAALEGEDDARIIEADLRFHQAIVALLDSPRLTSFYDSVVAALRPCLTLLAIERPSVVHPDSVAQHREIADAILARQGRAAERLVTAHIDANEAMLLEIVD